MDEPLVCQLYRQVHGWLLPEGQPLASKQEKLLQDENHAPEC